MKYLLFIGDGMADDPVPELGGRTPLEAAALPTFDRMSARGVLGLVCNCPPELPCLLPPCSRPTHKPEPTICTSLS